MEQGGEHQTDADIDRHGLRASEIAVGADAGDDVGDQVRLAGSSVKLGTAASATYGS